MKTSRSANRSAYMTKKQIPSASNEDKDADDLKVKSDQPWWSQMDTSE